MRMRARALCVAVVVVDAAMPARAYAERTTPIATRIDLSASLGLADFHRSTSDPTTQGGGALGLDVHIHPSSEHGFFVGYTYGAGPFGPAVSIFDGGYSLLFLGERRIGGLSGACYLDLGPAVGFVSHLSPNHVVVGGHAALDFDAYAGNLVLGLSASYQGGVPTGGVPDYWEGAMLVLLRVGGVFDVGAPRGPVALGVVVFARWGRPLALSLTQTLLLTPPLARTPTVVLARGGHGAA
jgi:hypothetical protein